MLGDATAAVEDGSALRTCRVDLSAPGKVRTQILARLSSGRGRRGGRPPSSTRSTRGRFCRHRTATASATSTGIRAQLDHLAWLGVDAIWLSPFFPSPMADFGYDVADYCDVDPLFGTLDDFDALLAEAHARGIRVLSTGCRTTRSDQHPWFVESRSSRDNPKRDWYVWRDGTPDDAAEQLDGGVHRRAGVDVGRGAPSSGTCTCSCPSSPTSTGATPRSCAAMHDTLRFWLDRGVDGFRIDVVHAHRQGPRPARRRRRTLAGIARRCLNDDPRTHAILRGIRRAARPLPRRPHDGRRGVPPVDRQGRRVLRRRRRAAPRVQLPAAVRAVGRRRRGASASTRVDRGARPRRRVADVGAVEPRQPPPPHPLRRREARARAAAVLLLTLRGTPFLYAGEELGLEDAVVPARAGRRPRRARRLPGADPVDAATRRTAGPPPTPGCRGRPSPTSATPPRCADDAGSILHLYRRLLAARRASPRSPLGDVRLLDAPDGVARLRARPRATTGGSCRQLHGRGRCGSRSGELTVEVASDGAARARPTGHGAAPRAG